MKVLSNLTKNYCERAVPGETKSNDTYEDALAITIPNVGLVLNFLFFDSSHLTNRNT